VAGLTVHSALTARALEKELGWDGGELLTRPDTVVVNGPLRTKDAGWVLIYIALPDCLTIQDRDRR
jgi:hypothetical protein